MVLDCNAINCINVLLLRHIFHVRALKSVPDFRDLSTHPRQRQTFIDELRAVLQIFLKTRTVNVYEGQCLSKLKLVVFNGLTLNKKLTLIIFFFNTIHLSWSIKITENLTP